MKMYNATTKETYVGFQPSHEGTYEDSAKEHKYKFVNSVKMWNQESIA